jgi:hypothetical protein
MRPSTAPGMAWVLCSADKKARQLAGFFLESDLAITAL